MCRVSPMGESSRWCAGVVVLLLFVASSGAWAQQQSVPFRPFELQSDHVIARGAIRIDVDTKSFDQTKDHISEVSLVGFRPKPEGEGLDENTLTLSDLYFEADQSSLTLVVQVPDRSQLKHVLEKSRGRRYLRIKYAIKKNGGKETTASFPVVIHNRRWALLFALIAVLSSFVVIGLLKLNPFKKRTEFKKDTREDKWRDQSPGKRAALFPLSFAITPIGTYSISLSQILMWTYITIFGVVYVFWLSGEVLEITDQMLVLLGIGGGTAVASKVNALSRSHEIPDIYLGLVECNRIPRLSDLISSGGRPNIFKFQILAFSLITGIIAVLELLKTSAFPEIPDTFITLMGVSSGVYLGNEVIAENKWKEIQEVQQKIKKHAEAVPVTLGKAADVEKLGIPEVDELKRLLNELYS